MNILTLHLGSAPLLISLPHDGTALTDDIASRLTDSARCVPDTDWFVSRLYAFAKNLGASILVPQYSRYVVDLNRSPEDVSLYPGQNTTGLCPVVQFNGEPVYRERLQPLPEEILWRIQNFWQPYHHALQVELERLKTLHGRVLLWEGHSIRSTMPFLFEGRLPDINIGTVDGASCRPKTQASIESVLAMQSDFTWVINGRFKGGYITRHYGQPDQGIEAVQLELAQCTYMNEQSLIFDEMRASRVETLIETMLRATLA